MGRLSPQLLPKPLHARQAVKAVRR